MSDEIRQILVSLSLSDLLINFVENKIDSLQICQALTDTELIKLGMTTIGERVRFREHLKKHGHVERADVQNHVENSTQQIARPETSTSLFRASRSRLGLHNKKRKERTWTGTFVCLADKVSCKPPNASQKIVLQNAGLGLKKIIFPVNSCEDKVHKKLMSAEGYCQLSTSGGFEILKCMSNCRQLEIVKTKWDVNNLRAVFGSQCKIYIRPIQTNLCIEPEASANSTSTSSAIVEHCKSCGKDVLLTDLREHVKWCVILTDSDSDRASTTVESHSEERTPFQLPVPEQLPEISNVEEELKSDHDAQEDQVSNEEAVSSESVVTAEHTTNVMYEDIINYCLINHIEQPTDILRYLQSKIVIGRKLEIEDETSLIGEGETSFIIVDRDNILETGMEEVNGISNPRLTLEVQFYGEAAVDLGGPRKEFFRLILQEIGEKYFSPVREWSKDYAIIGKIFALSVLQNGKLPRVMDADLVEELFVNENPRSFVKDLREGLDILGLFQITSRLTPLIHLFTPGQGKILTMKLLTHLLKPVFSPNGSNRLVKENRMYKKFIKYMRETASGRRGNVTLNKILQFTTGTDEEPVLGFRIHPSIHFVEGISLLPTSNTCVNKLNLTLSPDSDEATEEFLFNMFDLSFSNLYYGLQ